MATYTQVFSARSRYSLVYVVTPGTQDVANNRTSISWSLRVDETTENGSYAYGSYPWVAAVDGTVGSGATGYDFRNYNTLALGSGSKWVTHTANGTKTVSVSASYGPASTIGSASIGPTNLGLTTIPRASTSSWAASGTKYIGTAYTINTNRAASSFTHTLEYIFGSKSGTIATGVGASTSWTIPTALLTEIPNAASGSGIIRTKTYSGSTLIGTRDTSVTLTADPSVVPSFSTITHSEATPGVAANIGAYVQGVTALNLAITGAAGVSGSTITKYKISVGNQSINAASGTTNPIQVSGTVTLTGTVTDSRGRTATKTVNISVLAYDPPKFNSTPLVQRSLAGGTPNEEGTYLRVNINAAVQSLIVGGSQKNALKYRVATRSQGTSSWTYKVDTQTAAITFNSYVNIGTYSITEAYDVRVDIVDDFSTSTTVLQVPVAKIFMHWDASSGVGIGKYRENGALDVLGSGFFSEGVGLGTGLEVTNWNSAIEAGVYYGVNASNQPTAGTHYNGPSHTHWVCLVTVLAVNTSTHKIKQQIMRPDSEDGWEFVRYSTNSGSTWSSWKNIGYTEDWTNLQSYLASGITYTADGAPDLAGIRARRIGKIVELSLGNFIIDTMDVPTNGNVFNRDILVGIPSKFRPAAGISIGGGWNGRSWGGYIRPNGTVVIGSIVPNANASGTQTFTNEQLSGAVTYAAAD